MIDWLKGMGTAGARRPGRSVVLRGVAVALLCALAACGADRDYEAAVRANSIVGYDDYLRLHPDGAHAREARSQLALLVEDREWQRAQSAATIEAYQRYLSGYPAGQHSHDALVAITELNIAKAPSGDAPVAAAVEPGNAARSPAGAPAKGAIERGAAPAPRAAVPAVPAAPAVAAAAKTLPAVATAESHPPSAAAPVASPAHDDNLHGFRVQLGAFASGSAAASAAWQRLAGKYPELASHVPLVAAARTAGGRQVHRLQVGGYTREAATALCKRLTAAHDPCVLVPPLVHAGH